LAEKAAIGLLGSRIHNSMPADVRSTFATDFVADLVGGDLRLTKLLAQG
jgi:hypothetical protein